MYLCGLFCPETVDRFAVVLLSGFGNGLGPFGMMQSIGIELGFQGNAAALAVIHAALAGFVQEIACIELNAGAVSMDSHGTAGFWVTQNGTGVAENFKVVVVATLQNQRLVVFTNVTADG